MVKRLLLLIFLFIAGLAISERIVAQRILGAFSVGMNLTQVDGDDYYGFNKLGLVVGPMIIVPFTKNKNWSASMELLYSQKGSHHDGGVDSLYSYSYHLVQDYVEIPVLIHFTDKKVISGGVGFSYGRLINYRETKNRFFDSLYTYTTTLSNNDFSMIGDVQIRIWSKLWADLRYQYSMVSNRTVSINDPRLPKNIIIRKQYNNVISIRLTWVFNQPKIIKPATGNNSGGE